MNTGTIGMVAGYLAAVAFFAVIAYSQFNSIRRIFSRELKPGEVLSLTGWAPAVSKQSATSLVGTSSPGTPK